MKNEECIKQKWKENNVWNKNKKEKYVRKKTEKMKKEKGKEMQVLARLKKWRIT